MSIISVEGGLPLDGEISVSGAKNAALPLMAACILSDRGASLFNVPNLVDVAIMCELLSDLGLDACLDADEFRCSGSLTSTKVGHNACKMRASFLSLGPLIAKCGRAEVPLPGGCTIGLRPVNFHLETLAQMGAKIDIKNRIVHAQIEGRLRGCTIEFPWVSVGATQNVLMAACLAEGETIIKNAAAEPEVEDLVMFLQKMGAQIERPSPSVLKITGRKSLDLMPKHQIISDRIEAATYCAAVAVTGGKIKLNRVNIAHLHTVLEKLQESGVKISPTRDGGLVVERDKTLGRLRNTQIVTAPYPGFPSDLQAQFAIIMALAEGTSTIDETLFEDRFLYVTELNKMGAKIAIEGNRATITGVNKLKGSTVIAQDLRGAAALVIAALAAEGNTIIEDADYINRGYHKMTEKLRSCNATIQAS